MLYKGSNGGGDLYSSAVIDTIVAEVQNVPGEDRCVLLLGYKDQMEAMIQVNILHPRDNARLNSLIER